MLSTICQSCGDTVQVDPTSQGSLIPCPSCGGALYVSESVRPIRASAGPSVEITCTTRPCPMCGESLLVAASECLSCGEILDDDYRHAHAIYRDGKRLVMHRDARLPDICLKTNTRAEVTKKFTFYWHPPLYYFLILAPGGILLYVIVVMFVRHSAKVNLKFSRGYRKSLWIRMLVTWAITIPILILAATLIGDPRPNSSLFLIGIVLWGIGPIAMLFSAVDRSILPAKITKHYVWLRGVSRKYLAALPEWTGMEDG